MINPENVFHINPINDLKEHDLNCIYPAIGMPYCNCECEPTYEESGDDGFLIIHNSFDGRENFEPDSAVRNN
jgi:hypothetical protein